MKAPENPNNPNDWFIAAKHAIADEGVFSADQIGALTDMIDAIANGIGAATKNLQRKPMMFD